MSEDDVLSIGEVINSLREEFPEVSVSKVRFLESQGLLAPGRTDGGYRQFDHQDVARLRFILRQQRDHFLPLKVIKSKLTLWERGEKFDGDPSKSHPLVEEMIDPVTRGEVLRKSGLTDDQLEALVTHGMLVPLSPDLFSPVALPVAIEAARLFAEGLEARHLRAIRHSAERQADVLAQLTFTLLRVGNAEAHEEARSILEATSEAMLAIHRALLNQELRRLLDERRLVDDRA